MKEPKKTKPKWEKEFDKIFTQLAEGYSHHGVGIKSFIQKTIDQEVKEAVEKERKRLNKEYKLRVDDWLNGMDKRIAQIMEAKYTQKK